MLNISKSQKKALLLGMFLTLEHLTVHAAKISPMTVVSETEEGVTLEFNITEIDPALSSGSSVVFKAQPGRTAEFNAAKIAAVVEKLKKKAPAPEAQEKSSGFFLGAFSNSSSNNAANNLETWKVQVTANNANVFDGKTVDVEFRTAKPVDKQPLFAKQTAAEIVVMPGVVLPPAPKPAAVALPTPALPTPALPTPALPAVASPALPVPPAPSVSLPTQATAPQSPRPVIGLGEGNNGLQTNPVQVVPVEPLPAPNTRVQLENGSNKPSPWINPPPDNQAVYVSPSMMLPVPQAKAGATSTNGNINATGPKTAPSPAALESNQNSKTQSVTEKRLNDMDQRLDRVEMQIGQIRDLILKQQQNANPVKQTVPTNPTSVAPITIPTPPVEREIVITPTSQVSPFQGQSQPPLKTDQLVPVAVLGANTSAVEQPIDVASGQSVEDSIKQTELKDDKSSGATLSDFVKAITSATLVLISAAVAFRIWEKRKSNTSDPSREAPTLLAKTQSEMKKKGPLAPTEDLIDFMSEDNQMEVQIKDDGLIADSQNTVIIRREPAKANIQAPPSQTKVETTKVETPKVDEVVSVPTASTEDLDDRTIIVKAKVNPSINPNPSNVAQFPQKESISNKASFLTKSSGRSERIEVAHNDEIDEVLDRLFANGKS